MTLNDSIIRLAKKASKDPEIEDDLIDVLQDLFKNEKLNNTRIENLVNKSGKPDVVKTLMNAIDEAATVRCFNVEDSNGKLRTGHVSFWAVPIYGEVKYIDEWLNGLNASVTIASLIERTDLFHEDSQIFPFPGSYSPYMVSDIKYEDLYKLTQKLETFFIDLATKDEEEPIHEMLRALFPLSEDPCEEDMLGVRIALVGILELSSSDDELFEDEREFKTEDWIDAARDLREDYPGFSLDVPVPLLEAHKSAFEISAGQWEAVSEAKTIIIDFDASSQVLSLIAADGKYKGQSMEVNATVLRQHFEELIFDLIDRNPMKYTLSQIPGSFMHRKENDGYIQ